MKITNDELKTLQANGVFDDYRGDSIVYRGDGVGVGQIGVLADGVSPAIPCERIGTVAECKAEYKRRKLSDPNPCGAVVGGGSQNVGKYSLPEDHEDDCWAGEYVTEEVERLRARVAELEGENAHLKEILRVSISALSKIAKLQGVPDFAKEAIETICGMIDGCLIEFPDKSLLVDS
jgi:hypothetical protein